LIWAAKALMNEGADIQVNPPFNGRFVEQDGTERLLDIEPVDVDVIVLQRPLKRLWLDAIPLLQRSGVAVIVEVDDDFHSVPKDHPVRATYSPERSPRWLRRCCELADLVTVTTPALAERYGYGHCVVIPNRVPRRYLDIDGERTPVTVGWSGAPATHVGDLAECGPTIAELCPSRSRFHAIGSRHTAAALGVTDGQVTDWADLAVGYPAAVASLDIGIAPLAPNRFNDSKSALKMMEYGALGVTGVGSPNPDNLRMHGEGVGLIAATVDEWRTHLEALHDPGYRAEVAGRSREAMAGWTIEGGCGQWWEAWEQAAKNRAAA
jgi:hypothetical protein